MWFGKGHLLNLFFTHVDAAQQVATCPEVLMVDATYKTNLYKLPLINAVGVSNIGRKSNVLSTFQIAMAWLANEQEDTYAWFLQTLKEEVYDRFDCSPEVFMSDKDRALCNAAYRVFGDAKKMLCTWHMLA